MRLLRSAALLSAVLAVAACDGDGPTEVDEDFFGCDVVAALEVGDDVTGTLVQGDCVLSDDDPSFLDVYRLDLGSSRSVAIDMRSDDLDSFLILFDVDGDVIDFNDDRDGSTVDAEIVTATLPAGTYYIGANSFSAGETGAYTLSVR